MTWLRPVVLALAFLGLLQGASAHELRPAFLAFDGIEGGPQLGIGHGQLQRVAAAHRSHINVIVEIDCPWGGGRNPRSLKARLRKDQGLGRARHVQFAEKGLQVAVRIVPRKFGLARGNPLLQPRYHVVGFHRAVVDGLLLKRVLSR